MHVGNSRNRLIARLSKAWERGKSTPCEFDGGSPYQTAKTCVGFFGAVYLYSMYVYIYIAMLNVFASHKPKEKKDKHEHY